ncbi:ABC-type multidrug transport system, permease component [hydrothermal vent metagenome]|uniref:ABC-type multidrug transport system, permease component n=1 Tax=hydrothermal vent metagenome TaxID=652676 RepID=A0A1W1CMG2_9ZZZZ
MNNFIIIKTILVKEIMRFMRIWPQTLLPPIITTSLYLLIFGELIGQRIGNMSGVSYLHFIIPGIILMTVIQNSYANTVSSFYLSKFNHSIEELLVAPVPNWIIILGYVLGGASRGVIIGLSVTFTISLLTDFSIYRLDIFLLILITTAILFSLAGFINAIFAKSFDDISIIPTFVLMPLTYLGGMFYSIDILPEFWQSFSYFNPIFYLVDSFRFGFLGIKIVDFQLSLLFTIILIIILTSITLILLKRKSSL